MRFREGAQANPFSHSDLDRHSSLAVAVAGAGAVTAAADCLAAARSRGRFHQVLSAHPRRVLSSCAHPTSRLRATCGSGRHVKCFMRLREARGERRARFVAGMHGKRRASRGRAAESHARAAARSGVRAILSYLFLPSLPPIISISFLIAVRSGPPSTCTLAHSHSHCVTGSPTS